MRNKRCFVQFLHPGGEHKPDGVTATGEAMKGWNTRAHARKFLCNRGEYLTAPNVAPRTDDLMFWAEWEPPSTVLHTIGAPVDEGPRWVYRPYYDEPPEDTIVRNSDPFVFGDRFLYSNCQQRTKKHATQMRYLDRGSVLLFGSCKGKSRFVLDTVFVVDRWVDYTTRDYRETLRGEVSQTFAAVTLGTLATEVDQYNAVSSHRLYFGATYQNPVCDMFSFFPCLPYAANAEGFRRPNIHMNGLITGTLTQNWKCTHETNVNTMKAWWQRVVQQVTKHGSHLGIHTELPPYVETSAKRSTPRAKGQRGC